MATYRNTNPEGDLFEKVRRYISGLGLYAKPAAGIPASDLAKWVLPSAVTDYSVGGLGYTKNLGTVTEVKMNNATVPQEDGVVDLGAVQEKIDADHKLSADLIVDGTTNKVINVKPDWNAASGTDAEITLVELWSASASMLILFPNFLFLKLLKKALTGEIADKLGIDPSQVEEVLADSRRASDATMCDRGEREEDKVRITKEQTDEARRRARYDEE